MTGGAFHDAATKLYSGQDIRFTTKGNALYAIALAWPEDEKVTIKSLAKESTNGDLNSSSIHLLGYPGELKWTHDSNGLNLQFPAQKTDEYAYVFKILQASR